MGGFQRARPGAFLNNNYPIANQTLTIPQALDQAYAHWNAGQAQQAEQLCLRILQAQPGQADALHLMGVMAHAYGKLDMAVDLLRQACAAPGAPAPYLSNLAEMCRQKGLLAEAEQAARRAVELAPQLPAAWNNLGIILQESGKLDDSLACLEKLVALQPDNPEAHNNLANTHKRLGHNQAAQAAYRRALELHPNYAEPYSNLAFLLCEEGQLDEAIASGRAAIDINPQLADAYLNLAAVESFRQRSSEALRWLDALQAFAPDHVGALTARAGILAGLGHEEQALTCARRAVELAPESANAHFTLGQTLQRLARPEEAMPCFERAIGLPGVSAEDALLARAGTLLESGDKEAALEAFERTRAQFPHSAKALMARVDAKTFTAGDPDVATMEAALVQAGMRQQIDLHFALGKAWLDIGDSAQAFAHLNRANSLRRSTYSYDPTVTDAWMRRIGESFTPALAHAIGDGGAASEVPVFIIGMPRSGTTLVEQILASHPAVHGAGELSALQHALERAGAFPDSMARLDAAGAARIGADYLARVLPLAPQAQRIVDKMPANFLYAGVIPLALPGARIIHCRRDPVDTCLSCYSKHFGGEQAFAYDLAELGRFHRAYETLMARLKEVLPAQRFIEVDYEAVVDDLEGQARRLVDFIGLPWDDACLDFHKTRRVVRTASVAQVRQPIYTTSKGRWRKHAAQLGPLLAALGIEAA